MISGNQIPCEKTKYQGTKTNTIGATSIAKTVPISPTASYTTLIEIAIVYKTPNTPIRMATPFSDSASMRLKNSMSMHLWLRDSDDATAWYNACLVQSMNIYFVWHQE